MTDEQNRQRYRAAMHGVQTAVKFEISRDDPMGNRPDHVGHSDKHLRTGINSAMVNDEAVARLLINKGVFTESEYLAAIADAAERELARYYAKYPGITFA